MKGTWVAAIRGYVWVKLIGGDARAFLNAAVSERIALWNIAYSREGELTFGVTVPDFFRLRPLLKRSGARTRILQKRGLPFQAARLARRKTFAAGMLAFAALLFVLSTFVWQVKVAGESAIPENVVLQAARQEGVFPFQWSLKMKDTAVLARRMAARLPDAAWVGVEKKGTTVIITVVDSTKPEAKPLVGPSDIIAKADAVVTRIVAESGRPLVERNERVKRGQVLVSGWLGEGELRKAVVSKGTVRGLVWHEMRIVSPLVREQKTLTGASKERSYWVVGNRALQISGYGGEPFAESRTGSAIYPWKILSWTLPFGIMKEKELEVRTVRDELTEDQAKEAGLRQAREELLAKCGPDARITSENILHEHKENGKVMMTVLFEVDQSIGVERPIVQSPAG
ncbi:sporulation protein YqfD [Cohnella sp. CFH 77786]|uniref:sporulation protein YqfD n=1 Tax=Cohnella sp. CFH 77786 TaxID=2662265 RepID=UPI001C60AF35|nr:sporulation protein YqfD [Cohnella sp. CFH 77786]MBW5444885.1 sporulation protein YqfD [Cohnella sp. CFH 77786]